MSIETLTTDEFMDLEIEDHQEAIRQYDDSITSAATGLGAAASGELKNTVLDRMARLFTLRKVHKVRLEEMIADNEFEARELTPATPAIAACA